MVWNRALHCLQWMMIFQVIYAYCCLKVICIEYCGLFSATCSITWSFGISGTVVWCWRHSNNWQILPLKYFSPYWRVGRNSIVIIVGLLFYLYSWFSSAQIPILLLFLDMSLVLQLCLSDDINMYYVEFYDVFVLVQYSSSLAPVVY
jgi:hypothetical protein